ncbi:2OG-Fe(II) oxygenase [Oceanicoccus sp. KOV_DT_Chl]|uniref:2OG-Fe(II) oxygenase n=1 Tax=Oceanicoccus sp. KOV_DT_Chl TaxID=1904639 RepID=UPI000C7BB3D7|nr:2OG-Fe(II) oxygenase [Oceanicoccus sp. KOV_DT_Chl]
MHATATDNTAHLIADNETFFAQVAFDLQQQGYSINSLSLPLDLAQDLLNYLHQLDATAFQLAGIGRDHFHTQDNTVRNDDICWITGKHSVSQRWLDWAEQLKEYLNRQLFLGLFSFESHFAHYAPGHFYQRHVDAFVGQSNRVLSLVVYLNPDWQQGDGGELLIYAGNETITVAPTMATLVLFLSEEFPHEVLPAKQDRYSIAGWYRVNSSTKDRVDPPM